MTEETEPLYDGDMRLDNLVEELEDKIYEICKGRMTIVTIIGVLEKVKQNFLKEIEDDQ